MARQRPNSGEHIADIIARTACAKHQVHRGTPCFVVYYDGNKGESGAAVCGSRIIRAGFNGEIDPSSISRKSPEGKSSRVRHTSRIPNHLK